MASAVKCEKARSRARPLLEGKGRLQVSGNRLGEFLSGPSVSGVPRVPASSSAGPSTAEPSDSPSSNGVSRTAEPSANGGYRDSAGRFLKGNPGGPGNPFARKVAALRSALLAALTEEDVRRLARRLMADADAGDVAAARLLFLYAIGKPGSAVDPDTLDQQELAMHAGAGKATLEALQGAAGMSPRLACTLIRAMVPGLEAGIGRRLLERLTKTERRVRKQPAKRPQVDGDRMGQGRRHR